MNRVKQTISSENSVPKEINLKEIFSVIKRRLWIVIVMTFLAALMGLVYNSFFTTPLYQSSARIIIGADEQSMKTLQVIIKDTTVLENVIKEMDLEASPEALAGQISVASVDSSQVVSIGVVDTDPYRAAEIANTTAKVFKEVVPNVIDFNEVRFLSEAKVKPYPINDSKNRNIVLAFIVGLIAGTGLVFLLDSLDDTVKSVRDVEEYLGITVLGSVSKFSRKNLKKKTKGQLELEVRGETVGYK